MGSCKLGKHGLGVTIVTSHDHEDKYMYIDVYRDCSPRSPFVAHYYGGAEVDGININNYISSIDVIAPLLE